MSPAILDRSEVFEGTDFFLDAEVVLSSDTSDDGILLTQSDVSGSIALDVFERSSSTAIYSTTMSAASVIVNAPLPWRLDSVGRNFRFHSEMATFSPVVLKGGRTYTFVFRVTTMEDGILRLVFVIDVVALPV